MIGNSRLHWAWFIGESLQSAWDSAYLSAGAIQTAQSQSISDVVPNLPPSLVTKIPTDSFGRLPVYLASVVPAQTTIWQEAYANLHIIKLDTIPIQQMYPTFGIDRALALWGAGETWGFPMLVIDAGTALTFTGANGDRTLVGGAILPGMSLQFQSLGNRTAALPHISIERVSIPPRWATNTPESIQSGIIYTLIAAIQDYVRAWLQEFPESGIVLTGGDRILLYNYLQSQHPDLAAKIISDANLIFRGCRYYWQNQ